MLGQVRHSVRMSAGFCSTVLAKFWGLVRILARWMYRVNKNKILKYHANYNCPHVICMLRSVPILFGFLISHIVLRNRALNNPRQMQHLCILRCTKLIGSKKIPSEIFQQFDVSPRLWAAEEEETGILHLALHPPPTLHRTNLIQKISVNFPHQRFCCNISFEQLKKRKGN